MGWGRGGASTPSFRANYEHDPQDPRSPYIKLSLPLLFGLALYSGAPQKQRPTTTIAKKNQPTCQKETREFMMQI